MIYLFFIHIALIVFIALYIIKIIQNKYLSNLVRFYKDKYFEEITNRFKLKKEG